MKLRTKIFLGILSILLLLQIPFIINRWKTVNLAAKIANLAKREKKTLSGHDYVDYAGVLHVHSFLGGHSTGTFDDLVIGAENAKLDFVVMTEHSSELFDTSAMTMRGRYKNILFIGGNESTTMDEDRFLIVDGFPFLSVANKLATDGFLYHAHALDRLAFVTYPEKFTAWGSDFDGIEVFSMSTITKKMDAAGLLLDLLWSYRAYPKLALAKHFVRPDANLQKFDELAKIRRITLFSGTDAHSNLGWHIGDDANNKLLNFKLDQYETPFKLVRTHVLIPKGEPLERESLLGALKAGHCYIGFDILSDTKGFSFTAANESGRKLMGDEISLADGGVELKARAPQVSRFVIFKDGVKVFESGQTNAVSFKVKDSGNYRIEVYLDDLGAPFEQMPWIISNPIYIT